jgi:hypothetical protein
MSYDASRNNFQRSRTAGVLYGTNWEAPSTSVNSIPSRLESETQVAMDRLLRECLTREGVRSQMSNPLRWWSPRIFNSVETDDDRRMMLLRPVASTSVGRDA